MVHSLDLDFVRRQFPALDGTWIYLDNAGGSQTLERVVDRITDFLLRSNVQIGATYAVSQLASDRLVQAVSTVQTWLNAAQPSEIVLGSSTTQLLANLAHAMSSRFSPGDEIVVTNTDHESNIGPWRRLEPLGVRVRTWSVRPETTSLELEDLAPLLSDRTRLVCCTQTSNILGSIVPVTTVARMVHDAGAELCVDGVAYAAHRALDVTAWDVDYYAFSFYKIFGPHNAVLYGKKDRLLELANINHEFIGMDAVPYKLQPGKFSFELAYGLIGIVDYLDELGRTVAAIPAETVRGRIDDAFNAIAGHEARLAEPLLDYLRERKDVRILGAESADPAQRVPTISFAVHGRHSASIPAALDPHHIGVRSGHFYSKRLIDKLGLGASGGVVRVSMVHYNTIDEVQTLLRHLDEALGP